MRVLIACEYSGIIRDAFINAGHDAISCDFLPTELPGPHYQGDVMNILKDGFDLLIAHPPCTYLSYAGMASWNVPGREEKRNAAFDFFMKMINAPIRFICVENPRGLPNQQYRRPDQVIHPYYFGDEAMKRTCLWLKKLPLLHYQFEDDLFNKKTSVSKPEPAMIHVRKKTGQIKKRYWMDTPGLPAFKNGHLRSRSFQGIANAMAEQWGGYVKHSDNKNKALSLNLNQP